MQKKKGKRKEKGKKVRVQSRPEDGDPKNLKFRIEGSERG